MPEAWMLAVLGAGALVALFLLAAGRKRRPVAFADEREERLTRSLATRVGCAIADALPSVRKELELGPNQPDETILKRAAYHYRQSLPDKSSCSVFRDRAPG
jgi:hypothetical protein